ncbi:MAG: sulfatase-like hydrolase/transferase, partial [Deltaproteobacteria bacterium]|nr:sulfatase-like hydrolase/transferase [Deltaproteobacteria bacterium]
MRDRDRGRRRAAYASQFVERVANACEGVVVGKELPSFGGACAELLAPGEPVPATLLAHCLRASLERIIDDAAPEPLRPNVVLVLTDDQRPETLEFLPEIDRLADQGVLFTNAFATTSICTPSRASIYSGQYAHNHGSKTNNQVFDDSDTLAPWMSEAGYALREVPKRRRPGRPCSARLGRVERLQPGGREPVHLWGPEQLLLRLPTQRERSSHDVRRRSGGLLDRCPRGSAARLRRGAQGPSVLRRLRTLCSPCALETCAAPRRQLRRSAPLETSQLECRRPQPEACVGGLRAIPLRASIYSGQYAHNHGSKTNNQVFDDSDTLAPWMSEAGYA